MRTRGIPYPTGDPQLSSEEERGWRRQLLARALAALTTPVEAPTIFDEETESEAAGVRS